MREDWIECTLDIVCEKALKVKRKEMPISKKIKYLDIGGIDNHANRIISHKDYTWEDAPSRAQQIIKKGDVLFSTVRTYLKNIAKVNKEEYNNEICSSGFTVLRAKKNVLDSNYLFFRSLSIGFLNSLDKLQRGTSYPAVRDKDVFSQIIPLPPLVEQKAIVKKIEALFSSLDNGIADLRKAQEQLVIYRQAVLKKAFEGELTREWREKQSNLPTADELLEQIKEERQNYYEQQLKDWKAAVKIWEKSDKKGKKPSRISKPKEFPKVKTEETENYDSIPKSWFWTRFGTITYKIGDIDHKMPKTVEIGMPYVSTGNIGKDGKIDFKNAKQVSRADFDRLALKIKPEKGDIIFPRYGTIGRNILIDYDKKFLVSYSCAIIKNITKIMDEKFTLYYSLSPVIKREINRYVVETTQANIGIASIENFVYPLCSKNEQHQIVQEIESRLSVCDKVEESITESLEKAVALRQSILKKAFEGTLLSAEEIAICKADKDYEVASVLLERIKKEKKKISS